MGRGHVEKASGAVRSERQAIRSCASNKVAELGRTGCSKVILCVIPGAREDPHTLLTLHAHLSNLTSAVVRSRTYIIHGKHRPRLEKDNDKRCPTSITSGSINKKSYIDLGSSHEYIRKSVAPAIATIQL